MDTFTRWFMPRFVCSIGTIWYIAMLAVCAAGVFGVAAIMALAINIVGGEVSYWACVLASLAVHIIALGGNYLLRRGII